MTDSPVVSVDAHLLSVFTPEVEDNIKILLRFENGLSALCEMSTNCFVNLPRWHVSGTDGTAVVEGWGCHGKIVKLDTDEKMEWADDIVYTEAGPTRTMAPRPCPYHQGAAAARRTIRLVGLLSQHCRGSGGPGRKRPCSFLRYCES